jgi:hypothetical protein
MGGGGSQRPVLCVNELKMTGARSARARTRGQNPLVSIEMEPLGGICVLSLPIEKSLYSHSVFFRPFLCAVLFCHYISASRTNGFAPSSPEIGMHVEIRDPEDKIILSKVGVEILSFLG